MHRVGRSVLLLGSVACNTGLKPHLSTLGAAVSPVGVRSLPAARPQGSDDAASHSARYWRARKRQVPAPVPAKAVGRPPVVPAPVPAVPGLAVGSFGLRLPSQLRPPPCPPPAAMTTRAAVTSPARALPARVLPAAAVWGAPAAHQAVVAVSGSDKIGGTAGLANLATAVGTTGLATATAVVPEARDELAGVAQRRGGTAALAPAGAHAAKAGCSTTAPPSPFRLDAAPLLPFANPGLPSGRPSPAHQTGFLRAAPPLASTAPAGQQDWQAASILVDSGSQQKDLVSEAFAERLGVQGRLTGAAAQADGTLIPLYDVGNLHLAVNGAPTLRRFQRANIAPYDVILGEKWCEAESVVLDYANAALWTLQPGQGLLPLVLNAQPAPAAQAAASFLATHGRRPPASVPLPSRSLLAADPRYSAATWALRQQESASRVQQLMALGTRAGEDTDLTALLVKTLPVAAAPRPWGPETPLPTVRAAGSRERRSRRRHTGLLPVVDFNKELPEDAELDEREIPGLETSPERSFSFVESEVREHLAHLPAAEIEAIVQRLQGFESDVFETRSMPRAPPYRPIDLDITLRPGSEPPRRRAYRVAPHHMPELDRQIQLLLDAGMIRASVSEYAAPVLFAPKKDGKLRLCIDYRLLNAQTVRDRFPTPTAADLISSTAGGRLFSKIDLLAGFHQLRVREEDIHKTAFVTPTGQYEWVTAPFGLSATPSAFQRLMTFVLQEHIRAGYACVYLDDIAIWTKTDDPLEHLEKVEAVLASLREHGLIAKGAKCEFFRTEMEFLGFMVGRDGVSPVPGKVEAITEVAAPETVSHLRSFLGMVGFFRNHIPAFAEISAPLTDLLRGVQHGRQRLNWSLECEQAFTGLKDVLTSAPVLRHFDPSLRTAVHVDGSQNAIGAVLLQWEEGETSPRPVCFLSRKLRGGQFRYDARNVEALAAQIALSVWRPLLYGVRFELVSDHATLGTLLSQKALTPRLLRLCEFMADFDFDEVKYCRGPDHVVPDFLSRPWLAGGDAEAPSPLHLLSHPRLPDDTADTAAPSPLEVCVLISSTAGMVVGSQGTTLMLPRLKCLPDEDSRSAAARLCGALLPDRPTLTFAGTWDGTDMWRAEVLASPTLPAPWRWAPVDFALRRSEWRRRDFCLLPHFGLLAQEGTAVLLSVTVAAPDSPILQRITAEQAADPFLSMVISEVQASDTGWWRDFAVQDGSSLIFYQRPGDARPRVCVPASCRAAVLQAAHGGGPLVGHPGIARTAAAVARYFYWPRLYADVEHFVRSCRTCAAAKPSNRLRLGSESFDPIPVQPFTHWSMDLIGPLPKTKTGNDWIVTWVDRTSKTIVARACKSGRSSGADLADLTFEAICCQYGIPARLTHDNDVRFKKFWTQLWTLVGTKLTPTSAWNPQADPAERANRQVQEALRAAIATVGAFDEWDRALPYITFGLNTQLSTATGTSPFELAHGFAARTPLALGLPSAPARSKPDAARERALTIQNRFAAAADRAAAAQVRLGRLLSQRRTPASVNVGDWMWLDGAHVADQIPHKLAMKWYGPYEVREVLSSGAAVRLRLPEELGRISTVVNLRRLKFFEQRDAELYTEDDAVVEPIQGADGALRYEIDRVVMHRCHRGVEELFVHWKGYDASHGRWVTRASLLQDVPGLVAAYDANPSVLTARRSAPKRATKAPAQPLRRSRRGRAAVHALWTPLGRPVLLRLA